MEKRTKMSITMWLCVLGLVLAGCATTTDPRQGGLFSYNRKAYEQRLEERRKTLAALEKNRQDSQPLEREAAEKRHRLAEQKKQLTALDTELADVHRRIAMYKTQNQQQAAEKARLERNIRQIEARLQALQKAKGDSPQEVAKKKAKIEQLKTDMENLINMANDLVKIAQ